MIRVLGGYPQVLGLGSRVELVVEERWRVRTVALGLKPVIASALRFGISRLTYLGSLFSSLLTRTPSKLPLCSIDNILIIIPVPCIRLNYWRWPFSFSLPFLLGSELRFRATSLCFTCHSE